MEKIVIPIKILLIEDNPIKEQKIKEIISDNELCIELTSFTNSIDSFIELSQKNYDILILDMQFPLREGDEIQKDQGMCFLKEIEENDDYSIPKTIILFSEFDDSLTLAQDEGLGLITMKYSNADNSWEESLFKILHRVNKSLNVNEIVCYTEGNNSNDYSQLNLKNIRFISVNNSRSIFLQAVHEKDSISLRDKDFLIEAEIKTLSEKYKNYKILRYYCFENYLYHPDNIFEAYPDFNRDEYLKELITQKNNKLLYIVQDYKKARESYEEFKNTCYGVKPTKDFDVVILEALKSNDLEDFYPFFDMAGKSDSGYRKSFNKIYLSKMNLDKNKLLSTNWFLSKIKEIIT